MNQTTIFDAIAARDAAINQVAANNEDLNRGWKNLAIAYMERYCRTHTSFFPWEFVDSFEQSGYVKPHDWRAVGAIYRHALKEGWIAKGTDKAQHPKRHATEVGNWVSLIYRGGLQ